MTRRRNSPPTALRLVPGPVPPRHRQHPLPSLPQPAFHPESVTSSSASCSRPRHGSIDASFPGAFSFSASPLLYTAVPYEYAPQISLPLQPHFSAGMGTGMYGVPSRNSSVVSLGGSSAHSPSSSISGSPKLPRGPWDHSGCMTLPFDPASMLRAPEPVAISPGGR